jgi:hypothetical protein
MLTIRPLAGFQDCNDLMFTYFFLPHLGIPRHTHPATPSSQLAEIDLRTLRAIYQILTGRYVQVFLAWVGAIYLAFTLAYWLRRHRSDSESAQQSIDAQYVDSVSCFGLFALGIALLFWPILALKGIGINLDTNDAFALLPPYAILCLNCNSVC